MSRSSFKAELIRSPSEIAFIELFIVHILDQPKSTQHLPGFIGTEKQSKGFAYINALRAADRKDIGPLLAVARS